MKKRNNNTFVKEKIIQKLKDEYVKNIAIVMHFSPDGDAIGSAVALALALQDMNKVVHIICKNYSYLFFPIVRDITIVKNPKMHYDLAIMVDCSSNDRATTDIEDLSKILIVIDHHIGCKPIGNLFLCEDKSSTTMIIYSLLKKMSVYITDKIATALYLGIFGDTSGFSNMNTSSESHFIASKLINMHADLEIIYSIYKSKTYLMMKLINDILSKSVLDNTYNIIYSVLLLDDIQKYEITCDVTENIVNELKNVEEANIAFLFIESKTDTKIKARSKNNIDISYIMNYFGGGGHKYASGARIDSVNIFYIIDVVLDYTKQYLIDKKLITL